MGHISRHSTVYFLGTMFTAAAGYLFKIYVARVVGADGLGVFALGMTIVGFLAVFNGLGLPQAATRFVSAYCATGQWERLHAFLRRMSALLLSVNLTLAMMATLAGPFLALHFYHAPALVPYVPWFALMLALGGMTAFCGQVLAGYRDIAARTLISNFIATPLNVILGVALLSAGFGLRGYIFTQVTTSAIVLLLLLTTAWRMTPKMARQAPVARVRLEPEVFWFSAAAFGVGLLEFLLSQTDKILLGVFLTVRDVGIYAVAATMVGFGAVVLQSVNQIFSPTISDLYARGECILLGRMFQTLTKWILGLTLPLAFVMIVESKTLMRLFGPDFESGWIVLVIGTIGQLVNAGVGSVGYLLLMSGHQKRLIRIQAIMAAFVVVATIGLVKPFGLIGVAVAAALTNAVSNYLFLKEVRTALNLWPYNRTYLRLLGPGVISLLAILGLHAVGLAAGHRWSIVVASLVTAYVTFCSLALLFGLDDDDRMIVAAVRQRLQGMLGRRLAGRSAAAGSSPLSR